MKKLTEMADGEDIDDIVPRLEKSFDIHFVRSELENIKTFGELCELVISKMEYSSHKMDCTTQQAYYKLRTEISKTETYDIHDIKPDTSLNAIFPKRFRKKSIHILENNLGLKLNVLQPKQFLLLLLVGFSLASIIMFFFNWELGLFGFLLSIIILRIIVILGREFKFETVGELAKDMAIRNYKKSRRFPDTINRDEISKQIEMMFIEDLYLDIKEIKPETLF